MEKIYLISGLGADYRVFSFLDLSYCEAVYLPWIPPLKNETLPAYAMRLRKTIPEEAPVVIGVSFGGMLAVEMAKADPTLKAILLASSKTTAEIPKYLRAVKYFPFYKWMPGALLKRAAYGAKWVLGRNKKEYKKIILDIIHDTDINFVKWAFSAILHWKNEVVPANVIHIHGTADRILPCGLVKADHIVEGGPHVLPLDKHEEISMLLKKILKG